mgnify:FL=1
MTEPLPLSVSLITHNEEENLPRCLESVRSLARELVIVDSGSTDRTADVAARFGATVVTAEWPGFLAQKNRSLHRCTQPWVLCLDADEVVSDELAASIRAALADSRSEASGFYLNRRTYYLGDWIWHAWYPEWRLRLIRRGAATWAGLDPHPALQTSGATTRLPGDLLHYSFKDFADHLERSLRYARTAADSYAAAGRRAGLGQLVFSPWAAWFKFLVLKQAWRDGWRGWVIAGVKWADTFAKYAYLLERTRSYRRE